MRHGGDGAVIQVVQEDHAVPLGLVEYALLYELRVRRRVVLRGRAPQHLRYPELLAYLRDLVARAALRRAHQRGRLAGEVLDGVLGARQLPAHVLLGQVREPAVRPGVLGDLVALVGDLLDELRVALDVVLAEQEERRVDLLLLEDLQQLRRVLAGARVEGERDALRLAAVHRLIGHQDLRGGVPALARRSHRVQARAAAQAEREGGARGERGDPGTAAATGGTGDCGHGGTSFGRTGLRGRPRTADPP
ncbi:putative deacetylase [Streptomyces sp. Tu6071]|nr:putative deacetylase [Streptomyces sp. Tu6071]